MFDQSESGDVKSIPIVKRMDDGDSEQMPKERHDGEWTGVNAYLFMQFRCACICSLSVT